MIGTIVVFAIFLVLYHHAIYPVVLAVLAKRRAKDAIQEQERGWVPNTADHDLPTVTLVVPAYNESEFIADKLRNLATLDYPAHKFSVWLICDGCSDDTATIAAQTLQEPELVQLNCQIFDEADNRGKLGQLNQFIPRVQTDLLALSDVSALLSINALLLCAGHFQNPRTGAVSGRYDLANPGDQGQMKYWQYQVAIKQRESDTGSVLGAHGAFYMIRTTLCQPIPEDTINDDFIIPMKVILAGYDVQYEPRIVALELERQSGHQELHRRQRIAMGNVQQALRLAPLLHPRYGLVAFNFFSGKVLRAFMPLIMLCAWLGSLYLSMPGTHSVQLTMEVWRLGFCLQTIGYTLALWHHFFPNHPKNKVLSMLYYVVSGHAANGIGLLKYAIGSRIRW